MRTHDRTVTRRLPRQFAVLHRPSFRALATGLLLAVLILNVLGGVQSTLAITNPLSTTMTRST